MISRREFKEKAKEGNLITLYSKLYADLETPVSAFLKLRRGKFNFLLESVEGGTQIGRYSFLGRDPGMIFEAHKDIVKITQGSRVETIKTDNPLEELRKICNEFKQVAHPGLPPFTGGAVGYIAYDAVRRFEALPDKNIDDLGIPDIFFIFTNTIIAFDNVKHQLTIMHNVRTKDGDNLDLLYDQAVGVINQLRADVMGPLPGADLKLVESARIKTSGKIFSSLSKNKFIKAVERCKEYIKEGDIIQAVLSQRLETDFEGDAFNLYRGLRVINPSPYMFYLQLDGIKLVGASPEIHVRSFDRKVTIRPIAGTRPRGKTVEEDLCLEKELLSDEKEKAEHLMLVDLARNDIGRVCECGSVKVTDYMAVERYSHVMHIVSDIEGILEKSMDPFDLITATFPAGTVSGAPKVRAMEIVEELEQIRRGPYAGLVGYYGFNGNLDSCITIRTMLVKDNKIYVQAGAGIVADSEPEKEYIETLNKAKAIFEAINLVKGGKI